MKIQKIEHFSINSNDFEKSKDFYSRILGFKHLEAVDCGDFVIHYFGIPGGSRLELFDYKGKSANIPREESDTGLRHLAFQVEDVASHEKELRRRGLKLPYPPVTFQTLACACYYSKTLMV